MLKNLVRAGDGIDSMSRFADSVLTGENAPAGYGPIDSQGWFGSHAGSFINAAKHLSGESRFAAVHSLAHAEEIQQQLDAWQVIMNSPNHDQRILATTQHKRMLEELDVQLDCLGIEHDEWGKLKGDGFGRRVLSKLLTEKPGDVLTQINTEYFGAESEILKSLASKAKWLSERVAAGAVKPEDAAAFFARAKPLAGSIRLTITGDDGVSFHEAIDGYAKELFEKHPGLRPENDGSAAAEKNAAGKKPDKPKEGSKKPAINLEDAHDKLVMENPEWAYWLIRARIEEDKRKSNPPGAPSK